MQSRLLECSRSGFDESGAWMLDVTKRWGHDGIFCSVERTDHNQATFTVHADSGYLIEPTSDNTTPVRLSVTLTHSVTGMCPSHIGFGI